MPSIYRVSGMEVATNHTPILRLTGIRTAASVNQRIGFSDITDGTSNTLFSVQVKGEHATVWTKPTDLTIDPEGKFSEQLFWENGKTMVVMCDGRVSWIKSTTAPQAWHSAAVRDDGQPNRLETE